MRRERCEAPRVPLPDWPGASRPNSSVIRCTRPFHHRRVEVVAELATNGLGVWGVVDGHAVVVGRPSLLAEWGVELGPLATAVARAQADGKTAIAAAWDGAARAVFVVADTVKRRARKRSPS